jgi:alanine racemase
MDPLPLARFVEVVGGRLLGPAPEHDVTIEHVATHSARIRSGAAFFALPGTRADGHDFLHAAARNGAAALVAREDRIAGAGGGGGQLVEGVPVVGVADPLRSLQLLAGWWRRELRGRVVAVAGSIGKTVTKDALVRALAGRGPVYGTPGSYNSQLGVPLAVLDCPRSAGVAVVEVAVSDPGEMAQIAGFLRPDDVVVTNVGRRWRDRFEDRAHQLREMLSIARELPEGGRVLLGEPEGDLVAAAQEVAATVLLQGVSAELPSFRRGTGDPHTWVLEIRFPGGEERRVSLRSPSEELVEDVQVAISAAFVLGAGADDVAAALDGYTPTATRREIWRSPSGVTLVRDVATPDPIAVASSVRAARRLTRQGGRTVVVLGQAAGTLDHDTALELGKTLVEEGADEVLTVPPAAGTPLEGLIPVRVLGSVDELRRHLVEHLRLGDVCLVQSPPGHGIGELSGSLVEAMAPTRLSLDLSAMEENVATFRRLVGPSVRLMAMVKALAYGTDALALSLGLHASGVDFLGVAGADEGIDLRRAGVSLPIVVMLGSEDEVEKMVRYGLTPLCYSHRMVDAVCTQARESGEPLTVHVEVDTGMHRTGLDWTERAAASEPDAGTWLAELARHENVFVEGLMTHLASADDPSQDESTSEQLRRFEQVAARARELGHRPILHAAATAGAIRFPSARYDMVRIGLGFYGLHPSDATARAVDLTPALSLVSRIVQVKEVPAGEGVGYGGTWRAPAEGGRIGVVPAGYFDCVPRAYSNVGHVIVGGVRCAIVGTVSMDSMTIDLSGCPQAAVGSDVLVYGRLGGWSVPLEEAARAIGTIPYELMARVGPRVQRVLTRH